MAFQAKGRAAIFVAIAVAAGGISYGIVASQGSTPPKTPSGTLTSTARQLAFRADGTPILTGMTIHIANSAGSAHIGDAHIYAMEQILHGWGAAVSLTNGSGNLMEEAVAGGSQDICTSPVSNALDAGLVAFGPNQTSVAYALMTPTSITKLSQLAGTKYADDFATLGENVDYPLWVGAASKGGFSLSSLTLVTTGAESNSFNQVVAGNVSAAWVDPSTVSAAGAGFHTLTTGAKVAPNYADSMMFARGSWLTTHPATAEAIDLAWLASAKIFNTDEAKWQQYANSFTSGTNSASTLSSAYAVLKAIGGFATAESSFSREAVATNASIAKNLGTLTNLGTRPLSQIYTTSPWTAAWAQYRSHAAAY